MDLKDVMARRRSVRSFSQEPVPREVLTEMVDAARVAASAANMQPLEYVVVDDPAVCAEIFPALKWAAYIAPAGNPPEGRRPTAYVAVCINQAYISPVGPLYDVGASVMSLLLMGAARGVGSCWIKSVNYPRVKKILGLPEGLELDCVIALGYPDEEPAQVDLEPTDEGLEAIKYWRDDSGRHFVPKRSLDRVMNWQKYRS